MSASIAAWRMCAAARLSTRSARLARLMSCSIMMRSTATVLKPGGRLLLVANRGLPYEAPLRAAFAAVEEIARDGNFKVLAARR